jgi:hypothetical protein
MTIATRLDASSGFSLIEALIGLGILTVGAVGMASLFIYGAQSVVSSPSELTATQKAQEAVEDVFSARDSRRITWSQLRNAGEGGIFLDGDQPLTTAGADGIVNTADDGDVERVVLPGPDQILDTGDDRVETLSQFKRRIAITDVDGRTDLRLVTVTITYPAGTATRTHTLTTYISAYS